MCVYARTLFLDSVLDYVSIYIETEILKKINHEKKKSEKIISFCIKRRERKTTQLIVIVKRYCIRKIKMVNTHTHGDKARERERDKGTFKRLVDRKFLDSFKQY